MSKIFDPEWDELAAGKNCGFCLPTKDKHKFGMKIKDLSVSTLDLQWEQDYRGYCVLIFNKRHVTSLEQLTEEEYKNYSDDLRLAMKAIFKVVNPDHMNYATLGNGVPHLHYHIIPRYKGDPRWRTTVWTPYPSDVKHKLLDSAQEYDELAAEIRQLL